VSNNQHSVKIVTEEKTVVKRKLVGLRSCLKKKLTKSNILFFLFFFSYTGSLKKWDYQSGVW